MSGSAESTVPRTRATSALANHRQAKRIPSQLCAPAPSSSRISKQRSATSPCDNLQGICSSLRYPGLDLRQCTHEIAGILLSPQLRTMRTPFSRKRSRHAVDTDDDEEAPQPRQPSPALSDTLKRSKTQCELDELDIIEPNDAWTVDVSAILGSTTVAAPPGSGLSPHNNWSRYKEDKSMMVLCVQGNLHLHYNLLWYVP
jgi:hypothetical protein